MDGYFTLKIVLVLESKFSQNHDLRCKESSILNTENFNKN